MAVAVKRLAVWCALRVGAAEIRLRQWFPALAWFLRGAGERRALMAELQRLEQDPEFAAEWRAALDDELRQMQFNCAVERLLRELLDEGGADG
ncbi:hypothetical protein [Streptomyces albipurpureus]|uniref:Uncharacterized protein n=1 Tax=Streptomyces albipurpureus TaxID=2897419 RepID=A0ABT0UJU1_9ACTN|nr:hypothetical protein [Streptomyces sp. CWNU-1]MCM2388709.1 hypothetical protein [Streptomyces sp. CWNU-1]